MTRVELAHQYQGNGMAHVEDFCRFLEAFAPNRLAEEWDNVGLLVGDRARPAARVMTCLTVTPESVGEAIQRQVQLLVTHHPMPFRPLKKITADGVVGRLILALIENGVAVYSPHTAFDSAARGINQHLAEGLAIIDPRPLRCLSDDPEGLGAGRYGRLATPVAVAEFLAHTKTFLNVERLKYVGRPEQRISKVAVACGSAGEFLQPAVRAGCDCLLTGETNFHTCLEAQAHGVALVLPGHFASERFAVERLAELMKAEFPDVDIWASAEESDPVGWV